MGPGPHKKWLAPHIGLSIAAFISIATILVGLGAWNGWDFLHGVKSRNRDAADLTVIRDLQYVQNGTAQQRMDLYLSGANRIAPLIVFIHGGGWKSGSKKDPPCQFLLESGYAVASIDYRLAPNSVFPAQLEDCKAAIRWLRANAGKYGYGKDPIGAWGISAGGHLAALLGTSANVGEFEKVGQHKEYSSGVQAIVDWYGPVDLCSLLKRRMQMDPLGDLKRTSIYQLFGKSILENSEDADAANPVKYISSNDAPFLIIHGDRDTVVPLDQSRLLYEALREKGISAELRIVHGGQHGGKAFENRELERIMIRFYDKHIKSHYER